MDIYLKHDGNVTLFCYFLQTFVNIELYEKTTSLLETKAFEIYRGVSLEVGPYKNQHN